MMMPENERERSRIINVKKLYRGDRYWASLYMHNTPLNEIIESYRRIDILLHDKKHENEIFVSVKRQGHRLYYYAIPTDEMRDFLDTQFFTGCGSIEFIQQQSFNSETKESTYLDNYLITCPEQQIIGGQWLDYKSAFIVHGFFKLGIFAEVNKQ